jgi:hypothetical protein
MPTSDQTYIKTRDFEQAENNQGYCPEREYPISKKMAKGSGLSVWYQTTVSTPYDCSELLFLSL